MTRRDEVVEAGAKALEKVALSGRNWTAADGSFVNMTGVIVKPAEAAAAMLDAITEGMGIKLMGREPTEAILRELKTWVKPDNYLAKYEHARCCLEKVWDAAPWVPGGEK